MPARNTTIRDRHRKAIAKDKPDCSYERCLYPGVPIAYDADHTDPLSFTVDHTIPLHRGGDDELHNKTAMHRACNRDKSSKVPDGLDAPPRTFVTTLTW